MKKRLIYLLPLVLILLFSAKPKVSEDSLLWEISGNGLEKPSYLYGTIHIQDKRVFSFDNTIYKTIQSCDVLTGEIVMDMSEMMNVMNSVYIGDGKKLKDLYSDEDFKVVNNYLKQELGFMVSLVDSMKPLFIESMIGAQNIQNGFNISLDQYFQNYGSKNDKEIKGIETIQEQIAALDKIPLEEQAKMLLESIQASADTPEEDLTELMIQFYLKQDIVAIDSLINSYSEENHSFQEILLFDRNIVMAQRISDFAHQAPTFNTLGAGHLAGEKGVIQLLRKEGYIVTPVEFSFKKNPVKKLKY